MSYVSLDPRRWQLCCRDNADRLAMQMSQDAGQGYAVIKTACALQPYKVIRGDGDDARNAELKILVL